MNILHLNKLSLNTLSLNIVREYMRGKKLPEIIEEIWEEYIASGVDILSIKNTKENSISSLLVSGCCSQSAVPTPTAPVNIKCNTGDISYGVLGHNLLEVNNENIVVGKYINNAGTVTTSLPNLYFQRFVAVKPSTAYTLSTSETLNYANFMEYDENGVFIKRTLYGSSGSPAGNSVTHTMGETTAFVIIGSNVNGTKYPSITKKDVQSIKWMFNEGATALPYEDYRSGFSYSGSDDIYVYGKNLSVGELIGKGYASTGAISTSSTFCGNLHKFPVTAGQKYTVSWGDLPDGMTGVFINTWNLDGSWRMRQAISATDSLTYTIPEGVGEVNFTLYKTGGITIGENTWIQIEYGDTVTEYVPAVEPMIVSNVYPLFSVGDYVDTMNLTKGNINSKVGIKILNGTESISTSNAVFTIGIAEKIRSKSTLYCSHFEYSTSTSSAVSDMKIISFASQNIGFRHDACTDIESFRQFLQMEYAKGTPVIVIYPLAEEAVTTVAPLSIANPKGDITIIRDAEIDNLSMEVTCMVKVEVEPEQPVVKEIEFTLSGYSCKALEGMNWVDWCCSEYNPYNWDNVMESKVDMDIYAWYDDEYGENSVVSVDVYEWRLGSNVPAMIDSYTLALDGVECRAKDVIVEGAKYVRHEAIRFTIDGNPYTA
jgi:hypothetical protein